MHLLRDAVLKIIVCFLSVFSGCGKLAHTSASCVVPISRVPSCNSISNFSMFPALVSLSVTHCSVRATVRYCLRHNNVQPEKNEATNGPQRFANDVLLRSMLSRVCACRCGMFVSDVLKLISTAPGQTKRF